MTFRRCINRQLLSRTKMAFCKRYATVQHTLRQHNILYIIRLYQRVLFTFIINMWIIPAVTNFFYIRVLLTHFFLITPKNKYLRYVKCI